MTAAATQRTLLAAATIVALSGLVAVGSAGGSHSDRRDREAPTPPANVHVVAATQSSVSVDWDPAQDNVAVTGYYLYADGDRFRVSSTAYTVQNADCGQSIAIAVVAYDAAGNRSALASAIVSTAPCPDRQPPSAPQGFRQAATTQTSAVIEWIPSTDDVGVVRYGVYRGAQMVGAPTSPNAALTGLSCGSSTQFQVDAVDAAGNRSLRSSVWVSASDCSDGQPPSTPTGLSVTSRDTTSVSLAWNPSTDDVGVADYRVSVGNVPATTTTQPEGTVSGLTCGTTYSFGVDASDVAGNRSSTATVSAATTACPTPPPPTSEWTVCATEGQQCTFTGSKDVRYGANGTYTAPRTFSAPVSCSNTVFGDPVPGVAKRCELRDASSTTPPPPPPPASEWTVCASEGQQCTFTGSKDVRYGANGTYTAPRTFSAPVSCSNAVFGDPLRGVAKRCELRDTSSTTPPPPPPPAGDTIPPSPPTSLAVSASSNSSVSLTWSAATDNVGVTGYDAFANGVKSLTVAQRPAVLAGLKCGTAYQLGLEAFDGAGNRSARAGLTTSTAPCTDTQAPTAPQNVAATSRTETSIALSWSGSTDNVGVTAYGLYRGGAFQSPVSGTTGLYTGLSCNTNYTLAVDARDAAGNASARTTVMVSTTACPDTTPPSVPTGLAASNVTQSGLTLAWNATTDNVGTTGYDVYRNGSKVAYATTTSAAQTGLSCGTPYTFGVVARDAAGNSSAAAQRSVSTAACSTPPPPTSGWTVCATEGQQCTFTGSMDVRYGANGTYSSPRTFSAPVSCSNTVFGDPVPGVAKRCELSAASSTAPPPPPPPPPPSSPPPSGGTALDDFADFRNNVWTETFLNRWAPPAKSWTALGYTGPAWSDGSGIYEVSTPHGRGFRFLQGTAVPRASGSGVQMADIDSIVDHQSYIGVVTDVSGKVMFPASGNPNGFPAYGDWNTLWEFTEGVAVFNQFGVDALANKLYVRSFNPATGGTRKAHAPSTLQYDRWYDFRWQIKWSRGSAGFVNFWIDGQQIASWTGANLPSSSPAPWLQWGWYGGNQNMKNEVLYAALRKA